MKKHISKSVSLGIDFGMTYSSMAYTAIQISGYGVPIPKTKIATDKTSTRVDHQFIPSNVCAYLENEKLHWEVGRNASKIALEYKQDAHLFKNYKLLIGDAFYDNEFSSNINSKLKEILDDITPDQVAQKVIEHLWFLAFGSEEAELNGYEISSVSVTVPALWPERKKSHVARLVEEAIKPSQAQTIRIIEEPIAALYHQIRQEAHLLEGQEKHVLVIDYGGGTCDVAVVKINKDADRLHAESQKVAHVTGRSSLSQGGVQIDKSIEKYLLDFIYENGGSVLPQKFLYLEEAEKIKLSFANQIRDFRINNISEDKLLKHQITIDNINHLTIEMKASEFGTLIKSEISFIENLIKDALNFANNLEEKSEKNRITLTDVHHVFLAGGTNLLLPIKDHIRNILRKANSPARISDTDPRKAIVYGAALHAFYNDTGMGIGIGLTLQENIWLQDIFGRGIKIASKGQKLPYKYKHSIRSAKRKSDQIVIAIFRGKSNNMKFNDSIEQTVFKLSQPANFWNEFIFEVTIDESGLMDFILTRPGHPEDTFEIKRMVPYRADTEDIAERAEYSFGR